MIPNVSSGLLCICSNVGSAVATGKGSKETKFIRLTGFRETESSPSRWGLRRGNAKRMGSIKQVGAERERETETGRERD